MLDTQDLTFAIKIQQKSYHLLRWVAEAMDAGRLSAQAATRHADGPQAAVEWVRRYHDIFPRDIQVSAKDVDALGNFFWTYVVTSFDVVVDPGSRGAYGTTGYSCELCVRLIDAGHLKTNKLRAFDKRKALDRCSTMRSCDERWAIRRTAHRCWSDSRARPTDLPCSHCGGRSLGLDRAHHARTFISPLTISRARGRARSPAVS